MLFPISELELEELWRFGTVRGIWLMSEPEEEV
jgi:hypothetical protein